MDTNVVEFVTSNMPSDSCICGARPQEMDTVVFDMLSFGDFSLINFTLISLLEYLGIVTFSMEQIK